jgi:hypothetical protein
MRRWSAVLVVATLAFAGCSSSAHSAGSRPLRLPWQEVTLAVPPGPAGRLAVRDAAACNGTWYLVGAVLGADGESRPAAWRSVDGHSWEVMPLAPTSYYARRAILYSVACRGARVAALGERSGGAHGNPRVTSWYQRPDGTLVDLHAPFELYGGPEAVSVRRIQAGPRGWLITGNRLSGGAVWVSGDGAGFRIVEHDPALASNRDDSTSALDLVADANGWTVVGRVQASSRSAPSAVAWTSPDGEHWTRQSVPAGTTGFSDLERVVPDGDRLLAVGLRDRRFGTWSRTGGEWTAGGVFGPFAADLSEPPFVSGLVDQAGTLVTTVSDGSRFRLWTRTGHRWREISPPDEVRSTGDTELTVAADGRDLLLLSDDGTSGRVWVTGWNTLSR